MPPRKRPTSTTKKKAATKLKRAVKRGDVAPEAKQPVKHKHRGPPVSETVQASRQLQSKFVTLPAHFLEETRDLAAALTLTRPIPNEVRCFTSIDQEATLTCPRRPKWRFDMSKLEVERNEEGLFSKWLSSTDQAVEEWQKRWQNAPDDQGKVLKMPRSTTYFERNLEVWRQLWRVTEISQIILVLLDSRAPLLHYPPSLAAYLSDRRVILVLTKVDISGPERAGEWTRYFNQLYPTLRIVQVESYIEKEASSVHQGRKQHEPHIPESFRHRLLEAIRQEHAEMLEPPERVKANPARLESWQPPVKRDIDWERVMTADSEKTGTVVGGPTAPREDDTDEEPKFLTIGLIGQPNVGKSSLLNALFGAHKVRASKTPGKTKHFQTLFWTPDVRLVDCPGLVMPNFVPMEMQVLAGILPISRVSAVPSCIHHAAELLPLEKVYRISHPTQSTALDVVDKRTWRNGERSSAEAMTKELSWTAMDVLTGYADAKGWVTAKAGRSDIHRAGNAMLRSLAEGRVGWAFWPPNMETTEDAQDGMGIWIPRAEDEEGSSEDEESEEDERAKIADSESLEESDDEGESASELDAASLRVGAGRFGALQNVEEVESSDHSEEEANLS
ncbi:hypothetical protein B0H15DRAFT_936078 [Mycena belliarum]|uniref:Guanine nucleotide-binding protein-like 1 n=1 Tax=Mycena belliarum TaxID=1033014 RepID=A0AAD6XUE3_9AGAR|nr:hypothetical protein B0H15DRAFT_936078 [Mycena belliae]